MLGFYFVKCLRRSINNHRTVHFIENMPVLRFPLADLMAFHADDDGSPGFMQFDDPMNFDKHDETIVARMRAADSVSDAIVADRFVVEAESATRRELSNKVVMPKHLRFAAKLLIVYMQQEGAVVDMTPAMVLNFSEDIVGAHAWVAKNVIEPNLDILTREHVDAATSVFVRLVHEVAMQILGTGKSIPVTFRTVDGPGKMWVSASVRSSSVGLFLESLLYVILLGVETHHTRRIQFITD